MRTPEAIHRNILRLIIIKDLPSTLVTRLLTRIYPRFRTPYHEEILIALGDRVGTSHRMRTPNFCPEVIEMST